MDPVAQERAIRLACADAGIKCSELAAIELHGTGTPLGDPVEVSALARTGLGLFGFDCCKSCHCNVVAWSILEGVSATS